MTNEATPSENQEKAQAKFAIQRIYLKDLSFESPIAINARKDVKPSVSQDLHTKVTGVGEKLFEVVLNITVTVKQEEQVAFLVEVHQAGLFHVEGLVENQLHHLLSTRCPEILFPYARETIDSLAVRGGFSAISLPPINFDAIFAKAMAEAQAKAAKEQQAASSGDMH